MIHNSDIYYTYKGIYLSEKEKLLQGIHSANGLKPHAGQEKSRWCNNSSYNQGKRNQKDFW